MEDLMGNKDIKKEKKKPKKKKVTVVKTQ